MPLAWIGPRLLPLLRLCLLIALLLPAADAAVPNDDAAPAYAEEQTILQIEQGLPEPGWGSSQSGIHHFDRHFIVSPGRMTEQDVILQRGGNTWRNLHNGPMATTSAVVMIGVLFLIGAFYLVVGPSTTGEPQTGRTLLRFTRWQRVVHWSTAIAFVLLALSGLIVLFGKKVVMPWLGHDAFAALAIGSKWVHNVAGPLFVLFTLVMFVTFVGQNLYRRGDWAWLAKLGGMVSHRHVPADYFNAGEKLWFWGAVTLLGVVMAVSGLMLDFPYAGDVGSQAGLTRYLLQWADYLHVGGAALYIAVALGHIYLGTLGTPGAWHAMWHGTVDEAWARAHHRLWYDDVKRGVPGAPPAPQRAEQHDGSPQPLEGTS
jgi:formate dehydrogenase subunit gamma